MRYAFTVFEPRLRRAKGDLRLGLDDATTRCTRRRKRCARLAAADWMVITGGS
jgi:hypothetical protein